MFDPDLPKISTSEPPSPPKAHAGIKSLAGYVWQWRVFYLTGGGGLAIAGLLHLNLPAWDAPGVFIALSMLILFVIMGVRAKRFQPLYYGAYLFTIGLTVGLAFFHGWGNYIGPVLFTFSIILFIVMPWLRIRMSRRQKRLL